MRNYIITRVLLIIPTLFIVSIAGFFLSKQVPQDMVNSVLLMRSVDDSVYDPSSTAYKDVYLELGQDKPWFYFSVVPSHYPPNINIIVNPDSRKLIGFLLDQGYSFHIAKNISTEVESFGEKIDWTTGNVRDQLEKMLRTNTAILNQQSHRFYVPRFYWHGTNNQYHQWLRSFFDGSFGVSILDGKSALQKSRKALMWTLSITLVDIIISLLLGILLGVFIAKNPKGKLERLTGMILYAFYSLPLFWFATLMIIYFTTDQYGQWTNIFPSIGTEVYPGESTFNQIRYNFDKLILPIVCLTLHSLALITRFVRRSILNELEKPYVLTALSKGLTRSQVITRHVLPNALVPVVTLLGSIIPGAFAGSLVLEVIFNIPGFGRLLYTSISFADWNVSYCIIMIIAFVTVLSYLLSDILYAFFNPKIRYGQS
ncbi:MAG: ABC transporter permease [Bacteroidia bacterium]|nr:ABC transporter permease [Bacteroidia bacterium]